ncbi:MAG: hypothetical protein A4E55_02009 [Pelotomaculum sp. PtaU1.Bin035]|nr:MAG: hypothetical protein A4E55_02009 [Pelotomaculum sp. PtaU1.Bin035]
MRRYSTRHQLFQGAWEGRGAGSCYVHGGTSLQEVVLCRSAAKVLLELTNLSRKITSVIAHLTFFQNEPADEKYLPLRVTSYFMGEAGNRFSNKNIIFADSAGTKPDELKDMAYDKSKAKYLILKDEDEHVNTGLSS